MPRAVPRGAGSLPGPGSAKRAECEGKRAAIDTCRAFLKKYADHFHDYATIEVRIYPEEEWRDPHDNEDLKPGP